MLADASPEIIARVKENFEWWNDGEPELMVDEYADDAELDLSLVFEGMPVFRGHAGIRRQVSEMWETWEGFRMESIAVLDVGDGRYVTEIRLWGKGRRSGAEVEQRAAFVYTLRASDQKIVKAQLFPSREAALDFVGRSERPAG
jgi:ketosteroid isomerase-like protein